MQKKRFLKLLCFKFFFVISICLLWRLMELLLLRCYFYTKSSFQRWISSTFHEDHMECMRNSHKSLRSRDLGKELSLVVKRWTRGVTAKSEAFLLLKKKKSRSSNWDSVQAGSFSAWDGFKQTMNDQNHDGPGWTKPPEKGRELCDIWDDTRAPACVPQSL